MPRVKTIPLTPFIGKTDDKDAYCCHPGCRSVAEFPAPRRKDDDKIRDGFCLEHARLHNEAWNYFADMSQEEIEYHRRQDIVGWRPSWPLGERGFSFVRVTDPFDMGYESDTDGPGHDGPAIGSSMADMPASIRRSLNILGLSPAATLPSLKARYKELARRLHPDANGGDRRYEARFRKVHEAYEQLSTFFNRTHPSA